MVARAVDAEVLAANLVHAAEDAIDEGMPTKVALKMMAEAIAEEFKAQEENVSAKFEKMRREVGEARSQGKEQLRSQRKTAKDRRPKNHLKGITILTGNGGWSTTWKHVSVQRGGG